MGKNPRAAWGQRVGYSISLWGLSRGPLGSNSGLLRIMDWQCNATTHCNRFVHQKQRASPCFGEGQHLHSAIGSMLAGLDATASLLEANHTTQNICFFPYDPSFDFVKSTNPCKKKKNALRSYSRAQSSQTPVSPKPVSAITPQSLPEKLQLSSF